MATTGEPPEYPQVAEPSDDQMLDEAALIDATLSESVRAQSSIILSDIAGSADSGWTEWDQEYLANVLTEDFGMGGHDDSVVDNDPAHAAVEAEAAAADAAGAAAAAELTEACAKCWVAQATEGFRTILETHKAKQVFPLGHNNNLSLLASRITASGGEAMYVHVVNWGGAACSAIHLVGRSCPMTHPKVFGGPRWAKYPTPTLFKPRSFEGLAVCIKWVG